jgi:hypothetical protein
LIRRAYSVVKRTLAGFERNGKRILEHTGKDVSALLYWDAAHGADEDAAHVIAWVGRITGFTGGR